MIVVYQSRIVFPLTFAILLSAVPVQEQENLEELLENIKEEHPEIEEIVDHHLWALNSAHYVLSLTIRPKKGVSE